MFQDMTPIRTASAWALLADLAELWRPPEKIHVDAWTARERRLRNEGGGYSGPWDPSIAPYLDKPMRKLSDPLVDLVAVEGPSQAGKTEIGINWIGYQIHVDPADMLVCQSDKAMSQEFSEKRLGQLLDDHPRLRERQLPDQSADNIFRKKFRGMNIYAIWPVASQFRQRPVPRGWLDEYDQYDPDIDGQGDALGLMGGRQTTFEGREKTLVTSSPSRPDGSGIQALRESGANEAWHWPCPHCHGFFAADVELQLRFRRDGTAEDAASSAHVACPHCEAMIEPRWKRWMMVRGVWLQPHQSVNENGEIEGEEIPNRRWTCRFDGLFGFLSWGAIARKWYEAEKAFELRQDESLLKTVWNTTFGKNYRSRLAEAPRVKIEDLKDRCELGWMLGTVPPGVKFLTGSVDVQKGRFVVSVWGWGDGAESWLVDRFEIWQLEDGSSSVDPASHLEHWRVLLPLLPRRWPLAGAPEQSAPASSVPVLGWAIDTGGEPGVSDNAYKFWALATRLVDRARVTLVKGGNLPTAPLLRDTWLEKKRKGGPRKTGAQLFTPNVHVLKDVLDARLRREEPGPGYLHFPEDVPETVLAELLAEEKRKGAWVKIAARNELTDLYVYAYTVIVRLAGQRVDLGWVPDWASVSAPKGATPDTKRPVRRKDVKVGSVDVDLRKAAPVKAAEEKFSAAAFATPTGGRRGRGVRSAGVRV